MPTAHLGPVVGSRCPCTTDNKVRTKAWHATLCAHLVGASGLELRPARTTERRRATARTHTTRGQGVCCPDTDGRTADADGMPADVQQNHRRSRYQWDRKRKQRVYVAECAIIMAAAILLQHSDVPPPRGEIIKKNLVKNNCTVN